MVESWKIGKGIGLGEGLKVGEGIVLEVGNKGSLGLGKTGRA